MQHTGKTAPWFVPPVVTAVRTLDDFPQHRLFHMSVKLYMLGSLAWDYADTVLDMAAQMRIPELKKASRAVRELRADYDRLRTADLDGAHLERERELGLLFERVNGDAIRRLCAGLAVETGREGELGDSWRMLVQGVQMAMTVLDALRAYASGCDREIRSRGIRMAHSILPDHFNRLAVLLPEFAGDRYDGHSESRRITAGVLCKELKSIELYEE